MSEPELEVQLRESGVLVAYASGWIALIKARPEPTCAGAEVLQMMVVDTVVVDPDREGEGLGQTALTSLHEMGYMKGCDFAIIRIYDPILEEMGYRSVDEQVPGASVFGLFKATVSWPKDKYIDLDGAEI